MNLIPEDAKLVILSKASRARTGATQGAAVRDLDGRTYTASTVSLDSLAISALALAVAMAISSGARGLEAAALVGETTGIDDSDLAVVRDVGGDGVPVFIADAAGNAHTQVTS